jgi:hypothetical protein
MSKLKGLSNILLLTFKSLLTFDFLIIKKLPFWIKTLFSGDPLKDKNPRLSIGAISWFEKHLNKKMQLFEYGSGGSTLFFSEKVKKLVSVEHDKNWFDRIKKSLKKNNTTNTSYLLIIPQKGKNNEFSSSLKEYKNCNFKKYTKSITKFPDNSFDVVLVDGRARLSCLKEAIPKVKKEGYLILDNSERPKYQEAFKLLSKYEKKDFFGPSPYLSNNFVRTTFWKIE